MIDYCEMHIYPQDQGDGLSHQSHGGQSHQGPLQPCSHQRCWVLKQALSCPLGSGWRDHQLAAQVGHRAHRGSLVYGTLYVTTKRARPSNTWQRLHLILWDNGHLFCRCLQHGLLKPEQFIYRISGPCIHVYAVLTLLLFNHANSYKSFYNKSLMFKSVNFIF